MARLQIVPLPSGGYGVLVDELEIERAHSVAGVVRDLQEIPDFDRAALERSFDGIAEFVVFTPASLDVERGDI